MNISKTVLTIAFTIIAATSVMTTASANDTTRASDVYLAAGSDFNFKVFMNKKAKRFVRKNNEDWVTFNRVVRLYNNSTGRFLNISESEKADFFAATETIKAKLSNMNKREAQIWLKKVNVTEKVFNFLWSNELEERPLENFFELPASMEVEATVGR